MKQVHFEEGRAKEFHYQPHEETVKLEETATSAPFVPVLGYMISSALLLIINKAVVHETNAPNFVLVTQMMATSFTAWVLGVFGVIEVDSLSWDKIKRFWMVPAAFMATVFANIKILQNTNVETFIVFRASTPILLCLLEPVFLNRGLPHHKSLIALFILLMGAVGYTLAEPGEFTVDSVFWVIMWYVLFTFDQLFIKHAIEVVEMTTWGRVYYTNLLPVLPLLYMFMTSPEEHTNIISKNPEDVFTPLLLTSWVLGTSISFFAFLTRKATSATSFTVIGNVCKFLTIIVNFVVWDNHATRIGVVFLIICIMAAYLYEPAKKLEDDQHKRLRHEICQNAIPLVLVLGAAILITIAVCRLSEIFALNDDL